MKLLAFLVPSFLLSLANSGVAELTPLEQSGISDLPKQIVLIDKPSDLHPPSLLSASPTEAGLTALEPVSTLDLSEELTSVDQLSDIQPTDWAFQSAQILIDRYDCLASSSDRTFEGDRTLTRDEFAAGLNACLSGLTNQSTTSISIPVHTDDLAVLNRLQHEFAIELLTLQERIDTLESRAAILKAQQFSPTTQLRGQVIMAANVGDFTGDHIVDAQGRVITEEQPNPTALYRVALDLNTSFTGEDSLRILLETGSGGRTTNATGLLEPSFGSVLDFSVKPPTRNTVGIGRLVYSFTPTQDLQVAIGPEVRISDYIDRNRYANSSFRDFSTQGFINNLLLMTNDGPSAGGVVSWNPNGGAFYLRAMYSSRDAANARTQGPIRGGASFLPLLYPAQGGRRGLIGDTYQYTTELEYAPSEDFALRLQYAGGEVFNNQFEVFGVNFESQLSQRIALFGRYGHGHYEGTTFSDIQLNYWMLGLTFPDLLNQDELLGIAIGQPFIANEVGGATQANFEAFYRFSASDNIQISPLIQVVTSPSNRSENEAIVSGTVRAVFSF